MMKVVLLLVCWAFNDNLFFSLGFSRLTVNKLYGRSRRIHVEVKLKTYKTTVEVFFTIKKKVK